MDQPGNHILLRGNQPAAADRMRELLARTVQDQFANQRSNAGAIDDIRQRMEGLEWLVNEVRERELPGMTAQLDGLARQLGSLEETVLTLAEALLRPHAPHIPAPREASREASRDGSRRAAASDAARRWPGGIS